jgi:hypothetical protein
VQKYQASQKIKILKEKFSAKLVASHLNIVGGLEFQNIFLFNSVSGKRSPSCIFSCMEGRDNYRDTASSCRTPENIS